jgi:hypothetical protein
MSGICETKDCEYCQRPIISDIYGVVGEEHYHTSCFMEILNIQYNELICPNESMEANTQ